MKLSATMVFGAVLTAACIAHAQVLDRGTAPSLSGADWINGKADGFDGKVTILHFWTFECINCKHNLPFYEKWFERFKPDEVQMVGVHTPELPEEKDPNNVKAAVKELGIRFPVLIDAKGTNWDRYKVQFWPTVILIDKHGRIRKVWEGELQWNGQNGFGEITAKIEQLRLEK